LENTELIEPKVEEFENLRDEDQHEVGQFDDRQLDAIIGDQLNLEIETEEPEIVFAEFEGRRYSCAAHNIQLCLNHATKSTLMSSAAFKKHLKLQMRFAHSASARSELKAKGKLYKTFFKVR